MKKLFTFLLIVFIGSLTAQVDSSTIQTILTTGVNIATVTNNQIIPKVPNEITGSLITLIAGFLIRFFEQRYLRKKGKLID